MPPAACAAGAGAVRSSLPGAGLVVAAGTPGGVHRPCPDRPGSAVPSGEERGVVVGGVVAAGGVGVGVVTVVAAAAAAAVGSVVAVAVVEPVVVESVVAEASPVLVGPQQS